MQREYLAAKPLQKAVISITEYTVALAGNPNVGKSTIFNSFTGMHQHTGNWTGKTVENARGEYIYHDNKYIMLDLPGTYSLTPASAEETAACSFLLSPHYDVLVIVADAVCAERNLRFVCRVLSKTEAPAVICINLIDEAEKKGISVDCEKLSRELAIPVIASAARSGKGIPELKKEIENAAQNGVRQPREINDPDSLAKKLYESCFRRKNKFSDITDRMIDNIVLSKKFAFPIMLLLLLGIFWLTIVGANVPSQLLSRAFGRIGEWLWAAADSVGLSEGISSFLIDGVYTSLTWVVSVMLPPMAIFFPLFTLLEDSGFLPRIAFNLDTCFMHSGAHGKQALTTAMGFGCNACAVTGCRIIDSPRERLIAILTNSMIPCNGRFPMIISLIAIFFCSSESTASAALLRALILLAFVVVGVGASLIASKLLSKTLLRGQPSSFVLELPPYRRPQICRVIVRSIFDRTLFVLARAAAVAAPAGAVIWLLANISVDGISLIARLTSLLDPIGTVLGMDGAVLTAFLLGFPANEIVLPIAVMIYNSGSMLTELPSISGLSEILIANGWSSATAVCVIVFSLFHFPCSTTCLTIYKETKSILWTAVSFILPLLFGVIFCTFLNFCMGIM